MKNFSSKFFLSIILILIPFSVFSSGYKGNVLLEYPMIQENGENEDVVVEIPNLNTYPPQWWSPPYLGMGKWKCFFQEKIQLKFMCQQYELDVIREMKTIQLVH